MTQLRVITLNCWGIPVTSRDRVERMHAIGKTISDMRMDVIGLQEMFLRSDRDIIEGYLKKGGVNYSRYYPSGNFGSGLFILSRYPIVNDQFWRFNVLGKPNDLIRPEYYSGKGLAFARIQTPSGTLDVYNTHQIAPYVELTGHVYLSHRVAQAYQSAQIVNDNSSGYPVIFMGDLNSPPTELTYRVLRHYGDLEDSFSLANPDDPGYTMTPDMNYILVKYEPERADYILFRSGNEIALNLTTSKVVMDSVPEEFSQTIKDFSDHYGVLSVFNMVPAEEGIIEERVSLVEDGELKQQMRNALEETKNTKQFSSVGTGLAVLLSFSFIALSKSEKITRRKFIKILLYFFIGLLTLMSGLNILTISNASKESNYFDEILSELNG